MRSQALACRVLCFPAVGSFDLTAYINLSGMNIGYLFLCLNRGVFICVRFFYVSLMGAFCRFMTAVRL